MGGRISFLISTPWVEGSMRGKIPKFRLNPLTFQYFTSSNKKFFMAKLEENSREIQHSLESKKVTFSNFVQILHCVGSLGHTNYEKKIVNDF